MEVGWNWNQLSAAPGPRRARLKNMRQSVVIKRTKLINTSRVMREIWTNRETSRIDIARTLGLDKSTVSSIVNELLDLGVIHETREGEAGPQGGRRRVHITLNGGYGCVLGIEMRPESYTAVGVDLNGEVVFSKFEKLRIAGTPIAERLREILERVEVERAWCDLPLMGIGLGISGVVDAETGIIKYSIPLKIEEPLDLYQAVENDFPVPFVVENDANACAWGELAFHRHKELRDFLFCLVELRDIQRSELIHEKTAVGFGISIGGRVHYGHQRSAGEFRSIFRERHHKGQFALSEDEAFRIEEDPQVTAKFVREFAKHVSLFVNTFNLSHVFVGGNLDFEKENMRDVLFEEIQRNWAYPDKVPVQIAYSSLRERAVAYGAAGMVLERMFADAETVKGVTDAGYGGSVLRPGWPLGDTVVGT